MDINLLLQGKICDCGKTHSCPIKYVFIEDGAIDRLSNILADYSKVLIVADQNTYGVAKEQVESALKGKIKDRVIFSGSTVLIPNEESIDAVYNSLHGCDFIVGIGSGVIQDLCKYVSHTKNIPYGVVATAPSMDGYASSGAAMITGGMKVTYSAGLPYFIVADTTILANSPMAMIRSGYGDIIGKYSSLNDWKLSALINGEYFCQYIYDVTMDMVNLTISVADGLVKRDALSIKALMEALIVVGIMMSFAGNSRPASGSEHHLSHFFEIVGIVTNTPYFTHGTDVAYSTVITTKIREQLLCKPFGKKLFRESSLALKEHLKQVYFSVADGCLALQEKLGSYQTNRIQTYLKLESQIKDVLCEMPSAEHIQNLLNKVGLDISEFYALYGQKKINDAIIYAKDLKDRYTVL